MMNRISRPLLMLVLIAIVSLTTQAAPDEPQNPESLAKARLELAQKLYRRAIADLPSEYGPNAEVVERIALWSRRWMESQSDASSFKSGRIAAIESHRDRMKKFESDFKTVAIGDSTANIRFAIDFFEFHRLEAEFWLAKAKKDR